MKNTENNKKLFHRYLDDLYTTEEANQLLNDLLNPNNYKLLNKFLNENNTNEKPVNY